MNKIELTPYNIHRFILISVLVQIKYNEDDIYSNTYYAKIGGITLDEINDLENKFIEMIDFELWVENGVYEKYNSYLSV